MTRTLSPPPPRSSVLPIVAEGLFVAVVFSLLAVYALRSIYCIDIFWHIVVGEWIVENRAIPSVDTFSAVHPDRPWTPFQWLYEVIVYGLDAAGGLLLLRLVHVSLILLGFALLYRAARLELGPALAILVLTVGIVLFGDRFRVRPHVFNLVFMMGLLPVFFGRWRRLRWPGMLGVGAVGWLWANIHAGGALLMPVALGGVSAGALFKMVAAPPAGNGEGGVGWWRRQPPELRRDFLQALRLSLVVVVPMLLMPGFFKGVITAITMYGASVELIPEWGQPTDYFALLGERGWLHHTLVGFAPYVLIVMLGGYVMAMVLARRTERVPWSEVLLGALMLYLAQRSLRFVYLGVVPLIFLLRQLRDGIGAEGGSARRRHVMIALALTLSLGAMAVSWHYNITVQRGGFARALARIPETLEPSRFPVEAADFLAEAEIEGRVLHLAKWGGYLLYKLWPRASVFADGRGNFDMVQVGTLVATHRAYHRADSLERACRLYGFDIVIFPAPVFHELDWDRERWVRIYAGVEHHVPIEVFLRRHPDDETLFAANLERARAYYAARSDLQPFAPSGLPILSFAPDDLREFEEAVEEYWGRRWLQQPRQERRLQRAYERSRPSEPVEQRIRGHFEAAMIFYTAGALGPAMQHLMRAVELDGDDQDPYGRRARYYLAFCLYRGGHYEDARGLLMHVAALENAGPEVLRADEVIRGNLLINHLNDLLSDEPGLERGREAP